jgi:membrane-bound ClpP family serine protease
MQVDKKKRAYTLYSLGRLLFDEAILAVVLLWILPGLGINIPVWLLIGVMVAWAIYSFVISSLVGKVIVKADAVGTEILIGASGDTTTPLSPDGYVRVGAEHWQAHSVSGDIEIEAKVVVVGIKRLTLLVKPSVDTFDEVRNSRLEMGLRQGKY